MLNNYQVGKQTLRANDRDPFVEGAAGALVMSVAGWIRESLSIRR